MNGFKRLFLENLDGVHHFKIDGYENRILARDGFAICPACGAFTRELMVGRESIRCPGCIGEIKVERIMRKAAKARKESERQALFREAVRIRKRNEKGSSDDSDKAALARLAAILSGGG